MTDTERMLQAALDADPTDGLKRLALADHLDEIGDERAAGYRELGRLDRRPRLFDRWVWFILIENDNRWGSHNPHVIEDAWYLAGRGLNLHTSHGTRREAEDAAALAYARLQAAR